MKKKIVSALDFYKGAVDRFELDNKCVEMYYQHNTYHVRYTDRSMGIITSDDWGAKGSWRKAWKTFHKNNGGIRAARKKFNEFKREIQGTK